MRAVLSRLNSPRVTNSQAAERRTLAQTVLHVVSKPDMKALRRIDNLLSLVRALSLPPPSDIAFA